MKTLCSVILVFFFLCASASAEEIPTVGEAVATMLWEMSLGLIVVGAYGGLVALGIFLLNEALNFMWRLLRDDRRF